MAIAPANDVVDHKPPGESDQLWSGYAPYFTPTDVLSYFGKLRGIHQQELKQRISKVLEEVNMTEWSQKKIGKFSRKN